MSAYAQFFKVGYEVPAKFGWFLAAWAYVQVSFGKPAVGHREIALEEWDATPGKYLQHPDLHPEKVATVPGLKKIPNYREELFHKAGHADFNPSSPAAPAHH